MNRIENHQVISVFDEIRSIGNSLIPVVNLLESNSFVEGNKIAINQIIHNYLQKPWNNLNGGEKFKSLCGRAVNFVSNRCDYVKALGFATWDFVVTLIRAVASSVLRIFTADATPSKHWHLTGFALFSIVNSVLGIVTPTLANGSQCIFTALVIKGRVDSVRSEVSAVVDILRERIPNMLPRQV